MEKNPTALLTVEYLAFLTEAQTESKDEEETRAGIAAQWSEEERLDEDDNNLEYLTQSELTDLEGTLADSEFMHRRSI